MSLKLAEIPAGRLAAASISGSFTNALAANLKPVVPPRAAGAIAVRIDVRKFMSRIGASRQILQLMDELGYACSEGPLPQVPYESQIPK
jgi:hypothetical protein